MTDQRLEQIVGTLLRAGVLISAAVVLPGLSWLLAAHGESAPQYQPFRGEPPALTSVGGLVSALSHPTAQVLVQWGLLLLIATPVARVVFSLAAFVLERDRTYVVITMIVLGVLVYSLTTSR